MSEKGIISRRDLLLGLGTLTVAGTAACACSSTAGLLLWLSTRDAPPAASPTPLPLTTPDRRRPFIVSREAWGALPPDHTVENERGFYSVSNPDGWRVYETPLPDIYRTIIIHHAAFYEGSDQATLARIQTLHRDDREWADVGYHFMIGRTGTIYEGRAITVRGTHTESYNTGSLGICFLGNFQRDQVTQPQLQAAICLIKWLVVQLRITHLASHRDFNPATACPGDHLYKYLTTLAEQAGLIFGTDGYQQSSSAGSHTVGASCMCCSTV
jgi:hypothetical protein